MKDIVDASRQFDQAKDVFTRQTVSGKKPVPFTRADLRKRTGLDEETFDRLFTMALNAGLIRKAGNKWQFV